MLFDRLLLRVFCSVVSKEKKIKPQKLKAHLKCLIVNFKFIRWSQTCLRVSELDSRIVAQF